jgi:hypothetical protein
MYRYPSARRKMYNQAAVAAIHPINEYTSLWLHYISADNLVGTSQEFTITKGPKETRLIHSALHLLCSWSLEGN